MRVPAVLRQLPADFEAASAAGLHYAVERARRDELGALRFDGKGDGALAASELEGRRPLYELRAAGSSYLVRRFRHGGLLRWLTGERFLDAGRPFRELLLSWRLRHAGIPTPEVVAARSRRMPLFGWRLELVSRRVPESIDLGYVLAMEQRGELAAGTRRRLLRALGELLRRLHDAGLLHADLQPNNLLVARDALEGAPPRLWVLDLDRSELRAELGDEERRGNLRRLWRHVERRERERGRGLSGSDLARFFRGYDPARSRWKDDWRAIAEARGRGALWHRAGWRLERLFGARRDDRAGQPLPLPRGAGTAGGPRSAGVPPPR